VLVVFGVLGLYPISYHVVDLFEEVEVAAQGLLLQATVEQNEM
jgi:hypothetical protein